MINLKIIIIYEFYKYSLVHINRININKKNYLKV